MHWTGTEINLLSPILARMRADLGSPDGKQILVLCSTGGEVALWLAEGMQRGQVVGLELDEGLLAESEEAARAKRLESLVAFRKAERTRIPFPDETFDALISEFIIFPTPAPTEVGQPEMARVLKPGGRMLITDVIVTKPIRPDLRAELEAIGLDYLCEGTQDDFRTWMGAAGLVGIDVVDVTPAVRTVWERRRTGDPLPEHRRGYAALLDDASFRLGEAIFYIYVRGAKP